MSLKHTYFGGMKVIPLMRPLIPHPNEWLPLYQKSQDAGHYANFGPCFWDAKKALEDYGENFLPVSNGTVAVQIAAQVMFPYRSVVAMPDFTCAATANALIKAGMKPLLAPVRQDTWHLDPNVLWKNRGSFNAICVVSPFGYRMDWNLYNQLAEDLNVPLIYDCAGAWGQTPDTRWPVTYSFHATKNLAIGEGGAIRFHDWEHWNRAKKLITFDFNAERESQSPAGCNGKLDEIHCAMITAHLGRSARLTQLIARKTEAIDCYQDQLRNFIVPNEMHKFGSPSLCVLSISKSEKLETEGEKCGIQFKKYYHPMIHKMKGFQKIPRIGQSHQMFEDCLALPGVVSDDEFDRVIEFIKRTQKQ